MARKPVVKMLMHLGELLTKTVAAGLVAAIIDDRDRHRYRQLHRLVRADSLSEWIAVIDDVLVGRRVRLTARAQPTKAVITPGPKHHRRILRSRQQQSLTSDHRSHEDWN